MASLGAGLLPGPLSDCTIAPSYRADHLPPPLPWSWEPTPPLTVAYFTAIVKHNDSYSGEKLGPLLYFIASKRTFFYLPQCAASKNRTINLSKGFH